MIHILEIGVGLYALNKIFNKPCPSGLQECLSNPQSQAVYNIFKAPCETYKKAKILDETKENCPRKSNESKIKHDG